MSRSSDDRWSQELQAYHDGELPWWRRRRAEARLRRDPALREELTGLRSIRDSVRLREADVAEPDLWPDLAGRLRAIDAEREAVARSGRWASRWQPLGAAVAAGALTLALVLARGIPPVAPAAQPVAVGSVRSLDTGGRTVLVQERPESTIIWLMDSRFDEV